MSNSDNGGGLIGLIFIITVGIAIGAGILAWNMVEPESFFGAIGFIIVWGFLAKIGHFIAVLIAKEFIN
jgi:hypothetical protein